MKIESPSFTKTDLEKFLDEVREVDRLHQIRRLEAAGARLAGLAHRLEAQEAASGEETWTAHEVLAHISVLSKFYGVVAYRMGSGKMDEFNFLEMVGLRDVVGDQESKRPVGELLDDIRQSHERTLAYLRGATAADLQHRAVTDLGWEITAEEVVRLPLCSHLEAHLDQLEAALG